MGDETRQLATRFSIAVDLLARLAAGRAPRWRRRSPGGDPEGIRGALDALEEIYRAQTGALRGWDEERARVLAQLSAVRKALDRGGEELRQAAAGLVDLVGARPGRPAPRREPAPRRRR